MPEKKPDKKGGKPGDKKGPEPVKFPTGIVVTIVVVGFLLVRGVPMAAEYFGVASSTGEGVFDADFVDSFKRSTIGLITYLQVLSAFISLLFVMGIIYANFRRGQILREMALQQKLKEAAQVKQQKRADTENRKWDKVLEHVSSMNPSDWRLSILEADILLEEVLKRAGYQGESIGDRLKAADRATFKSLDSAWEAHKIRNSIAHQGSDFNLSQREAKRVIGLFEEVFKEFDFI